MLKNLPVLIFLFISLPTSAQTASAHMDKYEQMVGSSKNAQKTTNTFWRLAAKSNYTSNGTSLNLNDSVKYVYSNARGSSFSLNDLQIEDYGVLGTVLFDTAKEYGTFNNTVHPERRFICNYNSSNKKISFTYQTYSSGNFGNYTEERVIIDGNGKMVKRLDLDWVSGKWDTTYITEYFFDGQNKPILDSAYYNQLGTIIPAQKTIHTYDGNGNNAGWLSLQFNGTSWDSGYQVMTTWISSQPAINIYRVYDNSANKWDNISWDSTGYDSNGNRVYNLGKEWDTTAKKWQNSSLETRTLNSKGQPTTAVYSEWDGGASNWNLEDEAVFTYDMYDNLVRIDLYAYFNGTQIPLPVYVRNYYNEHYFNVGIDNLTKNTELKVYPNPAHDLLNVVVKNNSTSTVRLTNMTGQTMYTAEVKGTQIAIPVSNIATGNYILSVGDTRQLVTIQ